MVYVEAGRTYDRLAPANDPGCPPTSLLRAWLSEDASGAITLLDKSIIVTDCDRQSDYSLTPFGFATLDGRAYALTEGRGYEDERYGVIEIEARAIRRRVTIGAGGC